MTATLILVSVLAGNTVAPITSITTFSTAKACTLALEASMAMQLRVAQSNLTGTQQPTLEKTEGGYRLVTPVRIMSEGQCISG